MKWFKRKPKNERIHIDYVNGTVTGPVPSEVARLQYLIFEQRDDGNEQA